VRPAVLTLIFIQLMLIFSPRCSLAQPPLWSEDASILPLGESVVRVGGDYAYVGGGKKRFRLPAIYFKCGLGGISEWVIHFNLGEVIEDGKELGYDVETFIVASKLLLHKGGRGFPETSIGFGVKIPSEDTKKGLGSDTTDFYARLMLGQDVGPRTRIIVNFGLGILEKINELHGQDDIFQYALAVHQRLNQRTTLLAEFSGHTNSTRKPTQNFLLVGLGFATSTHSNWDISAIIGLNPNADDIRLSLGYTTRFKLF